MHFTDSHIHLQDYLPAAAKKIYEAAHKNNVCEFVVPSAHPSDWAKVIKILRQFPDTIGALGIHPWYVDEAAENQLEILDKYLQKYPHLWVGECGIDRLKNQNIAKQRLFFEQQIDLALKYNRPMIIHAVKADSEMNDFLPVLPQRSIFHSFNGTLEWGKKLQNQGFYLGLNFSFFKKNEAAKILMQLNLEQILLETDAPYQPNKGYVKNSPENLPVLVAAIAAVCDLSETKVSAILAQNFKKFNQK